MSSVEACKSYEGVTICICSFFINMFAVGIVFNFGVMLPTFLDEFGAGRTLTGKMRDLLLAKQRTSMFSGEASPTV